MKKLTQTSLLFLAMIVAFAGCDAAKEAATDAANNAKDNVAGLADLDLGDFDLKGMQDKFAGITDGFKDVTAENVDGLKTKISDLSGSMDSMGLDKIPGPAKTAIGAIITKFRDAIKSAMDGISDESILSKLKPVVEGLMTKLDAFK